MKLHATPFCRGHLWGEASDEGISLLHLQCHVGSRGHFKRTLQCTSPVAIFVLGTGLSEEVSRTGRSSFGECDTAIPPAEGAETAKAELDSYDGGALGLEVLSLEFWVGRLLTERYRRRRCSRSELALTWDNLPLEAQCPGNERDRE